MCWNSETQYPFAVEREEFIRHFYEFGRRTMKMMLFVVAIVVTVLGAAAQSKKEITGITAEQVRWFTPSYY